jgi:hypothetical protein
MIDQHIRRRCGEQPADPGTAHRARDVASLRLPFGAVVLAALLLVCGFRAAKAQDLGPLQGQVSLFGAAGTGERLPFWLGANTYGTVDRTAANLGTRLAVRRPFADGTGIDLAAGATVIGRASAHGTAYLHESYGGVQAGPLRLVLGRKAHMVGRVDTPRSLGSTTWSRNATPPPAVRLSVPTYLPVPGTHGLLAARGAVAHGWLEDDRFVEDALLHAKTFYLRVKPPGLPVDLHAGIAHHAQFGGTHPRLGPQGEGLDDWTEVVLGQRTDGEDRPSVGSTNHLAMYDFSMHVDLGGVDGRVYRQFYHEDTPSLRFRNPWDGLWGLRLARPGGSGWITAILWEHLRMTRQNAKFSEGEERGADKYYHHSTYAGGWTYEGRTLGIPLLTPNRSAPGMANTIVVAHHAAVQGQIAPAVSYRLVGTYSRNYGAQGVCANTECTRRVDGRTSRRDQWSFLAQAAGPLSAEHGLRVRATVALDTGAFYEERVGLRLGLTWRIEAGAR